MEPSSFFFNEWLEEGKIRELNGGRVVLKISFGRQATLGFPCGSAVKESARKAGDVGSTPGLKRSPGEGKGYPLQYSGLENPMDSVVHGVTKSWTLLSDFQTFTFRDFGKFNSVQFSR